MKKILILLSGAIMLVLACKKDKIKYNAGVTPAVVTTYPVNVTATSAALTGISLTGGKGITRQGFYTVMVSPDMYDTRGELDMTRVDSLVVRNGVHVEAPVKGDFEATITGLTGDTIYFVKAYAANDAGVTYGESVLFRSSKLVPPVVMLAKEYINIGDSAAVITGEVTAVGGDVVTERGLVWSTHENPEVTDQKVKLGTDQGSFTDTIPSLLTFVKYYVRAYAINRFGTAYSEQLVVIFLPPSFTDPRDGEEYTIKQYGNAVWMTQNFRHIPATGFGTEMWMQDYNGTDGGEAKKNKYYHEYGCLYTYDKAVAVAPAGWHLATDEEWKQLEILTGLTRKEADDVEWRGGSNEKLKSNLWPGQESGAMEFNIHPGGKQWCGGAFQDFQSMAFYWTGLDEGVASGESPYYRFYPPGNGTGRWNNWPNCVGLSVRYVRD
ncbi:fibrobacter succinogenes major paralogous domain-containing protein [Chitinophaga sp. MM2321]|uniref:fibrobacter succinogenes major paralogous domain-containing protein n=1 Tax=Chitinophaga sp. MM2321 TaxID=3137178 RepID=UPI0032D56CC5